MEQQHEDSAVQSSDDVRNQAVRNDPRQPVAVLAQAGREYCPACTTSSGQAAITPLTLPSYTYAIGKVDPRFPRPSVEKELAQVMGRSPNHGLTDKQAFYQVLQQKENRYLVRQMCWVMTIQGLETYILVPRDSGDYDVLLQAAQAEIVTIVGMRGPIAKPDICNGLMVPIVICDLIYSFSRNDLIKNIPKPESIEEKAFTTAAGELFDRVMQLADNAGATDRDRALNYLTVRYPAVYHMTATNFAANASLTGVDVQPSRLSATRNIVDVIFSYTNRNTDVVEKFFTRVDVTEQFPFLVTKMSPFYDR